MATYYISAMGDDRRDGLTPETAWKTTDYANRTIAEGDTILLRRGDIFYGRVRLPAGTTLAAYGEGERPRICLYKITTSPDVWTEVRENVWKTSLSDKANYTGNIYTDDTNVGFIYVNGDIKGYRRFSHDMLNHPWEFLCEGKDLYVYSEGNPNEVVDTLYFSVNSTCISPSNHNHIRDIDAYGCGGHGIAGVYANVTVENCDFHELGGSELPGYPTPNTRYGNGLEIWSDTENVTVDGCRFYNIYDVAFTMQGYPERGGWRNVAVKNCVMWGNHQSFEIWTDNVHSDDGMTNCEFRNNVCIGAGMGWSDGPRPNKECGVHLLIYGAKAKVHDIKIRNNIFYDTAYALYFKVHPELPAEYDSDENFIYFRDDAWIIKSNYAYTAAEKDAFIERTGREKNSVFRTVEATGETVEELAARLKKECWGE